MPPDAPHEPAQAEARQQAPRLPPRRAIGSLLKLLLHVLQLRPQGLDLPLRIITGQTGDLEFGVKVQALEVVLFQLLLHLVQRSEEHTSELQSLMRTSYAVFCLKKK